jgi:hypothetical protein
VPMSTSTRIHILLPNSTLADLDARRGLVPRSSYVRDLIQRDSLTGEIPELIQETGAEVIRAGLQSVKPHRHRYHKSSEEPVSHKQGRPLYLYMCECGETEVR